MYAVWLVASLCSANLLRQPAPGKVSIDEFFGTYDEPYPENELLNGTGVFMNSTSLTNGSLDMFGAWKCPVIHPDKEVWKRTGERVFAKKKKVVAKEKTYLFVIIPPMWGSTAVLSLLSTSPEATTLCSANTWACEGLHLMGKPSEFWEKDWPNYKNAVNVYEKHWDMSKSFLVEKSPPNIDKYSRIAKELASVGKKAAFIIMTRSPCQHEYEPAKHDSNYIHFATDLAEQKSKLPKGTEVYQFTYEALLKNPYKVSEEILDAFPGLKSLDPNVNDLKYKLHVTPNGKTIKSNRQKTITEYVKKFQPFKPDRPAVPGYLMKYAKSLGYGPFSS